MSAWTDVIRRIGDQESGRSGAAITVGPGPDGFGVTLRTDSKADKDWFGQLELTVSKEIAEQLGNALIAASKESEA